MDIDLIELRNAANEQGSAMQIDPEIMIAVLDNLDAMREKVDGLLEAASLAARQTRFMVKQRPDHDAEWWNAIAHDLETAARKYGPSETD